MPNRWYGLLADHNGEIPLDTHTMADLLEAQGLPVVSTFDDRNHWDMIGSMISESIVYFSGSVLARLPRLAAQDGAT
jgi:hypothetical protein